MISICIPSYNYGHYLAYAIDSSLSQDEEFELVVLDNCSTDDTPQLRERYANDSRVRWFQNEELLPVQRNWNKVVSLATGSHIKVLQADDALKPGSIHQLKMFIRERPHVALHGHLADIIDADGSVKRHLRGFSDTVLCQEFGRLEALRGKLMQQIRFREPTCNLFSKDAWERVGGYESSYRFVFDISFNVRIMDRYPVMLWNKSLAEVRRHSGSDGARLPAELALAELESLTSEILDLLGDQATVWDAHQARALYIYRLLELSLSRAPRAPLASLRLIVGNLKKCSNPIPLYFALKLLSSRLIYGDVQQQF